MPDGYSAIDNGIFINDLDRSTADVDAIIQGSQYGDLIAAGLNNDKVKAGSGNDRVWGGDGHDSILSEDGNDTIDGNKGNDTINGGAGNDIINGSNGNDLIAGSNGTDTLYGGKGADKLEGGANADMLILNRVDLDDNASDVIIFRSVNDSNVTTGVDTVHGFASNLDIVDLRSIDANTQIAGDQAFKISTTGPAKNAIWVKITHPFFNPVTATSGQTSNETTEAGSMGSLMQSLYDSYISADINGDAKEDFKIHFEGYLQPNAIDFIL